MRDDIDMDAHVVAAAEELFGNAIDPRELYDFISKADDASEMHVNRNLNSGLADYNKDRARKNKRQAQIGLAGNIVGVTAGGAALMAAGKDKRLKNAGSVGRAIQAPYKAVSSTKVGTKWAKFASRPKIAGGLALGAVGLQGLNTAGDVVTNRVLNREVKRQVDTTPLITVDTKKQDIHIKKALDHIVQARRDGIITTDRAIQMAGDLIDKAAGTLNPAAKEIHGAAEQLVPMAPKKPLALKKVKGTVPAVPNKVPQSLEQKEFGKSSPDITWTGEISKVNADKRQVFGYCTVTSVNGEEVIDLQGDYIPLDEIEKAAYTYVVESRKGGDMHSRDGEKPLHTSNMIESFIVTPEKLQTMGLPDDAIPHGWWVGFQIEDDKQWDDVKTGKRTAFSIHGAGRRVEKML